MKTRYSVSQHSQYDTSLKKKKDTSDIQELVLFRRKTDTVVTAVTLNARLLPQV